MEETSYKISRIIVKRLWFAKSSRKNPVVKVLFSYVKTFLSARLPLFPNYTTFLKYFNDLCHKTYFNRNFGAVALKVG